MKIKNRLKIYYLIFAIGIFSLTTVGATYAYWASSANSDNVISTNSISYSISMSISPLYHGFSFIPMDGEDTVKAIANGCKDKYDRGACSAYTIYVYDYNADLDYISGYMDVTTNNMQNLSYMMLRLSDTFDEDNCVTIEESQENYCIVKEATAIGDGVGLSLGDSYDVTGITSTKFILLMWLSNFDYSQNDIDVGSFDAIITMQAGNGGEIKGSIASAIQIDNMVGDGQ